MNTAFAEKEPARAEVDALAGATLQEFGTPWCGHCRAAQPLIEGALAGHAGVRHLVRPSRPEAVREALAHIDPA